MGSVLPGLQSLLQLRLAAQKVVHFGGENFLGCGQVLRAIATF